MYSEVEIRYWFWFVISEEDVMTEKEHMLVGGAILFILWHILLKNYFRNEKDLSDWQDEWNDIFYGN